MKRKRNDDGAEDDGASQHSREKRRRTVREGGSNEHRKVTRDITPGTSRKDTPPRSGRHTSFPSRKFDFSFTGTRGRGPSYIEKDVERMRRWMLLSGTSFYTWPHHDAAGLLTWTMLLTGMKLWSYVVPNDPKTDLESAAKQYVDLINAMDHISIDTENQLPNMATAHNFFLAPNTILWSIFSSTSDKRLINIVLIVYRARECPTTS